MESPPFLVSTMINGEYFARTLIDTGTLSYGLCDSRFAQKHSLERIKIAPRQVEGFDAIRKSIIDEVAVVRSDINGYEEQRTFLYVVPRLASYDIILGLPWAKQHNVVWKTRKEMFEFAGTGITVRNEALYPMPKLDIKSISANAFTMHMRGKGRKNVQSFAVSLADVQKALKTKVHPNPKDVLPPQYHDFLDVFDRKKADLLPPLRGNGVDHKIEVEQEDGKEKDIPWGPLYSMSRDELLVLRKTLTEYLDKGFIRVSNSPAAAPVLFVRKPGGGLRFCVDYRALNRITRKDRYPLPLIYDTLRNIRDAKWFTKLDIIAAFHKIRIARGEEWKTAFRTRYGLFEWLVTPFGMANAPSTFQKFINWALREYLDEFCSAYIDDILIYTNGSLSKHQEHVRKVLAKLQEAGLQVDIGKCEFEQKSTKYLGFIIQAEEGIKMDPEKVKAIQEWETPTTIKGIQGFIGFANFYRKFIEGFSRIVKPITDLVRKGEKFKWTSMAEDSFQRLKQMFISAPILAQFDPDLPTILETDASGWCLGGTLFQVGRDGFIRPCAYFSRKMNKAECNYEIHDKEMLAIVRCLEEWDTDLRSVKNFEIRTDHKNLEYFMTSKRLTERQMRWSIILSRYSFTLNYIKGEVNQMADALSRRDQDLPKTDTDPRIAARTIQLLPDSSISQTKCLQAAPVSIQRQQEDKIEQEVGEEDPLNALWEPAREADVSYNKIIEAVKNDHRKFPVDLGLKVSIAECSMEGDKTVKFRNRIWVPDSEELRTKLIQHNHDSVATGHPGRNNLEAMMCRKYFWPLMLSHIRRFVRNCDLCGANKAWKEKKVGFLKPLPVPERVWREISIDFIVDLPPSNGRINIMVITDRLSKGVIFKALADINTETVARAFIRNFYRYHGFPDAIVSDRGKQFVGALWKRICELLRIKRRVSTAFHPETDGGNERSHQALEDYLRTYCGFSQDDWYELLPSAEVAINNRDSVSTGVSPFFLSHGYHLDPLQISKPLLPYEDRQSPVQKADNIVRRIKEATEWAQTTMAVSQQRQEDQANRYRQQAVHFQPGDKVWLDLRHIRTERLSKKLDARHAKFKVIRPVGSHAYELEIPRGIHNVFHTWLLRPASEDPFPSQSRTDVQPPPIVKQGEDASEEDEYEVEQILEDRWRNQGRGRLHEYLVKWKGYQVPTWERDYVLEDTIALDLYETERRTEPQRGGYCQGLHPSESWEPNGS